MKSKTTKKTKTATIKKGDFPVADKLLVATKQVQDSQQHQQPLRQKVALLAGYPNAKISTVAGAFSKLKKQGLIEYPDNKTVCLTPEGYDKAEALGDAPLPDAMDCSKLNEAALDRFKSQCKTKYKSPKGVQILDILSDGRAKERTTVATMIGIMDVKSSTFAGALSNLRKIGALEYLKDENKNMVQLTDAVFPMGRPSANKNGS